MIQHVESAFFYIFAKNKKEVVDLYLYEIFINPFLAFIVCKSHCL